MVLNRKGFFLELGEKEPQAAEAKPEPKQVKAESAAEASQPAAAPVPVEEIAPASPAAQASAPAAVFGADSAVVRLTRITISESTAKAATEAEAAA